ncbi:MAG: hypothetical protein QXX08_05670 [Candidatus Bathyarchaeia archaeon]
MKGRMEIVENNGEYALVKVKAEDLLRLKIQEDYREILLDSYLKYGFPKITNDNGEIIEKTYDGYYKEGNVVVAYTSDSVLMLDCDLKREDEVIEFAREYAKFHDLGSALVMKTSESTQVDLYGKTLGNYCIIFGRILTWDEIKWHVKEAFRLGMVNKGFVIIRKFGSITIRVNAKNDKIPPPTPVYYFSNGDKEGRKGIWAFLKHWAMCRKLGKVNNNGKKN